MTSKKRSAMHLGVFLVVVVILAKWCGVDVAGADLVALLAPVVAFILAQGAADAVSRGKTSAAAAQARERKQIW
jgi:multisubunit Na+/H+ antiporter MnhG subunit